MRPQGGRNARSAVTRTDRSVGMEQLLALGSVVRVRVKKDAVQRLMIAGYFLKEKETGRTYDYAAVPYPFGVCPVPVIRTFNQPQIVEVEHRGYMDEQAERFTGQMPELINKMTQKLEELAERPKQEPARETAVGAGSKAEAEPVDPNQDFG